MEKVQKKKLKSENNYMLEIKNLTKCFENLKAVNNLSLKVEKGDVFGFLGPNGAGKTTTIRMILGLIHSDEGEIIINGYNIRENFNEAISNVGAVVETPKFYEYLSGYQNLKQIINLHSKIDEKRIKETLEIVGLKERAKDKVKNYSLGMKQRLGIARALLIQPSLIILDEPTNGLDPQGMKEVRRLISKLAQEKGITFFISTHLLNEVEQICNKVAILKKGEIIVSDYVRSLLDENQETIEFITPDKKEVKKVVEEFNYAEFIQQSREGVIIKINEGYTVHLNSLLIDKNISIKYIIPKNQSLEDFFIEITEESDEVA